MTPTRTAAARARRIDAFLERAESATPVPCIVQCMCCLRYRGGQPFPSAAGASTARGSFGRCLRGGDVNANQAITYTDFLRAKALIAPPCGLTGVPELSAALFPFQRDIVSWALRRGRKFLGAELKRSYFQQACANLKQARSQMGELFGT